MPHFLGVLLLPPKNTACASSTSWPYSLSSWVSWSSQRWLRSFLPFRKAVFLWYKAIHWTVRKPFWAAKSLVLHESPQMWSSDKENMAEVLAHNKWDEITSTETTVTSQQSCPCQWGMLCALYPVSQLDWDEQSSWSVQRAKPPVAFSNPLFSPPFFSFPGWKAQFHLGTPLCSGFSPSPGLENEPLWVYVFPHCLWVFGREVLKAVLQIWSITWQ